MEKIRYSAPCLFGLEGILADELRKLEACEVSAENGRVLFSGDISMAARANLWLRTAERVEIVLGRFRAETFDSLFEQTKKLPWETLIPREAAFPVKGWSLNSQLFSVSDCQAIIKKAVAERLGKHYGVSWLPETGSLHSIRFSILKNEVTLMLDTSGVSLHKRGYRKESVLAPIKETLAAGMVYLARPYSDSVIYDPFCGSGTILIEAALLLSNTAPGIFRNFECEKWENIPKNVFSEERTRALDIVDKSVTFKCVGSDIDPEATALTEANAAKAGIWKRLLIKNADVKDFSITTERGVVITNPPYGERMLDVEAARKLYTVMGDVFVKKYGFRYNIISPDEEFEKLFGRKADKRRKLYNGMLKCQLFEYFK